MIENLLRLNWKIPIVGMRNWEQFTGDERHNAITENDQAIVEWRQLGDGL